MLYPIELQVLLITYYNTLKRFVHFLEKKYTRRESNP